MNNVVVKRFVAALKRPVLSQNYFSPNSVLRSFTSTAILRNETPSDQNTQEPEASGLGKLAESTKVDSLSSTTQEVAARIAQTLANPYNSNPVHHLHVYAHKHNTHLTLTRPNRDPLMSLSCGSLGFRKAHRSGYDPAHQLTSYMFAKIQERGFLMDIQRLEVIYRGFGQGREAFSKVLLGPEGKKLRDKVIRVTDASRVKFGGTRSPKVRRLG